MLRKRRENKTMIVLKERVREMVTLEIGLYRRGRRLAIMLIFLLDVSSAEINVRTTTRHTFLPDLYTPRYAYNVCIHYTLYATNNNTNIYYIYDCNAFDSGCSMFLSAVSYSVAVSPALGCLLYVLVSCIHWEFALPRGVYRRTLDTRISICAKLRGKLYPLSCLILSLMFR